MTLIPGFTTIIYDKPIGQKQFRFPRSKKKRIRIKWQKRPSNYKPIFLEQALVDQRNKTITCTSRMAEKLRRTQSL
jgi:hypothetical protein